MIRNDEAGGESPCPRCGEAAEWRAIGANGARVEVECPDCGRMTMTREELEQAMLEPAEQEERA